MNRRMAVAMVIGAALLTSAANQAKAQIQVRAEPPPSVELQYRVYIGGLHALSMTTRLLREDKNGYRMAVDAV